jgi:hypothetical protein
MTTRRAYFKVEAPMDATQDALIAQLRSDVTALQGAVSTEATTRDEAIAAAVAVEAQARADAVAAEITAREESVGNTFMFLNGAIEKEVSDRVTAVAQEIADRTSAVANEATARDSAIATAVGAEAAARIATDITLGSDLATEVTRASNVEGIHARKVAKLEEFAGVVTEAIDFEAAPLGADPINVYVFAPAE